MHPSIQWSVIPVNTVSGGTGSFAGNPNLSTDLPLFLPAPVAVIRTALSLQSQELLPDDRDGAKEASKEQSACEGIFRRLAHTLLMHLVSYSASSAVLPGLLTAHW